jgi:hypothetical protein
MTRVGVALGAGLALLVIALVVTLSGSPQVLANANATPSDEPILEAKSGAGACQDGELVPAGISGIRLTLVADAGPRVSVSALSGTHVLTSGTAGSGWTSGAVTVPVKVLAQPVAGARICFKLGPSVETVQLGGSRTSAAVAATNLHGRPLPGRFTVEYIRSASRSWWSTAETVARHIGLGRAPSGSWVALLLLAGMGAVLATASWLLLRELL